MRPPEDPAPSSSAADDALERAHARLDEACARLAARLDALSAGHEHAPPDGGGVGDLNAALAQSRRREAALADAARSASHALDEAMAQLRAVNGGRR